MINVSLEFAIANRSIAKGLLENYGKIKIKRARNELFVGIQKFVSIYAQSYDIETGQIDYKRLEKLTCKLEYEEEFTAFSISSIIEKKRDEKPTFPMYLNKEEKRAYSKLRNLTGFDVKIEFNGNDEITDHIPLERLCAQIQDEFWGYFFLDKLYFDPPAGFEDKIKKSISLTTGI